MSKIYEDEVIPAHTCRVCVRRKCDLCGAESNGESWRTDSSHDVAETEIKTIVKAREGKEFPEAAWGTAIEVDLCPACFKDRLVPWLREHGAKIEEESWSW